MRIYNLKAVKSVLVKHAVALPNLAHTVLLKILTRSEYALLISFNSYGLDACLIANCKNTFIPIALVFGFTHASENGNDNACLRCEFAPERPKLNE